MERRSVLLAAGDKFVGDSIGKILEQKICGKELLICNDGMDALESILLNKPSFMILDLHLPRLGGLAILEEINTNDIKTSVLCYCRKLRPRDGVRAIKAGARGVIDLGYSMSDFTNAARNVRGGRRFIPENIKRSLQENDFELFPEKYRDLTTRQIEVVQMTAEGLSNMEVAFNMNISVKAVEKHKRNLRDKLGLLSSLEIGLFALREGFVEVKEGRCL
ncbi:MAG: response regulator transcription factor [Spirochaetia bacterium]|jgi:DNA-binding NarL/FixJ family response regulator|nr:response regulator transcription factor [Spirochaetia bacterium]